MDFLQSCGFFLKLIIHICGSGLFVSGCFYTASHFGKEHLIDDFKVLTSNANPLNKIVEDTNTGNLNPKNQARILNKKLMNKSSGLQTARRLKLFLCKSS